MGRRVTLHVHILYTHKFSGELTICSPREDAWYYSTNCVFRNLSAVGGESVCESLVRCDGVTALSAMLKEVYIYIQYHPIDVHLHIYTLYMCRVANGKDRCSSLLVES